MGLAIKRVLSSYIYIYIYTVENRLRVSIVGITIKILWVLIDIMINALSPQDLNATEGSARCPLSVGADAASWLLGSASILPVSYSLRGLISGCLSSP